MKPLGLTREQLIERRKGLGGSDAAKIIAGAGKIAGHRLSGWPALARLAVALERREQASGPRRGEAQEPDIEDILSEQPPRLRRGAHYVGVVLLLVLVLIAALLKVDVIVAAGGRLVPDGPPGMSMRGMVPDLSLSVSRDSRSRCIHT